MQASSLHTPLRIRSSWSRRNWSVMSSMRCSIWATSASHTGSPASWWSREEMASRATSRMSPTAARAAWEKWMSLFTSSRV